MGRDRQDNRRGVSYKDLLEQAHEAGIKSIKSWVTQIPNENNGWVAVCAAEVVTEDGRIFQDVGDADPSNVGRSITPHIIRMASTRAKARCLRDFLKYGEAADEEMGEPDALPSVSSLRDARQKTPRSSSGGDGPSDAQMRFINKLVDEIEEYDGDLSKMEEDQEVDLENISIRDTSLLIDVLKAKKEEASEVPF